MIDISRVRTLPISDRKSLVHIGDLVPIGKAEPVRNPRLKELAQAILAARKGSKNVMLMMGAHPIKVGMSLFLIDILRRGFITHLATNGAAAIHDFELALIGATSEDVAKNLEDGTFGMAEETGSMMNSAVAAAARGGQGFGQAVCRLSSGLPHSSLSIFNACLDASARATVHVAIGTDIIHQHPSCDGAAIGSASYHDFLVFADSLKDAAVVVNLGSAVIMPEVFLKALTVCRNLGYRPRLTTANMDMQKHYRPTVNVVERPAGKGLAIIGRHEQTIPALHRYLVEGAA